jgi:ABC-type lipoprotein export system ATPase subunit
MADTGLLYNIEDLSFEYQLGRQSVTALQGVSLQIQKGCLLCLSGPSGSGKTTLLNLLGLIEPVQKGSVLLEGKNLAALSEAERNHLRRYQIGFVFQSFHLIPVLSAEENVDFFLIRQGIPTTERRKRVQAALEAVGIWNQRAQRPLEMSGGQRQRVAIARAIAKKPEVIIADEPTANLDQLTGREIMEIFRTVNQASAVSVVLASHDPMVQSFAQTRVTLRDGKVVSSC